MERSEGRTFLPEDRETVVVNGRFALRTERLKAAREGALGRQVIAVEHLAERLAGGFMRVVSPAALKKAVLEAVPVTDLGDLESIKGRSGFSSAATRSLRRFWLSGYDPADTPPSPRLEAVMRLDAEVGRRLPANMARPHELVAMAIERAAWSRPVFGRVVIKGMTDLHPVWVPLLAEMSQFCNIWWETGPHPLPEWLRGTAAGVIERPLREPVVRYESCSNPRHEAVEALRWARRLISEEGVPPGEIAVATAAGHVYDGHFAVLRNGVDFDLHMSGGVPALYTKEGQQAAALADVLLRGLSQKRVRRLVEAVGSEVPALRGLPADWTDALRPEASLTKPDFWRRSLGRRPEHARASEILMPVIAMLARGAEAVDEAGEALLPAGALEIWNGALLDGPAGALDRTLQSQRVRDDVDPLFAPCYMSAEDLAASPRRHVRLIGLASGSWPRQATEDPILPEHVIAARVLDPLPLPVVDRRDFRTVMHTSETVVVSRPRRDPEGRALAASSLVIGANDGETRLLASRMPAHAMSWADRLAARPDELRETPQAVSAMACWSDWHSGDATAHDGVTGAGHPRVRATLARLQSASSLSRLAGDPAGWTWRYALGFRASESEDEPLFLSPRHMGSIFHDVLRQAVSRMEPRGGFTALHPREVAGYVDAAALAVAGSFELSNPVPPQLVWHVAMQRVVDLAKAALAHDGFEPLPGQRSYVETPFGGGYDWAPEDVPWDPHAEVTVPGTGIRLIGFIDRIDVSKDAGTVRAVDYKSGKVPSWLLGDAPDDVEMQRGIYGFAVRALLGRVALESGLLYPEGGWFPLADPDGAMESLSAKIADSAAGVLAGTLVPGPGAFAKYADLKFALPANASEEYLVRKQAAFARLPGTPWRSADDMDEGTDG